LPKADKTLEPSQAFPLLRRCLSLAKKLRSAGGGAFETVSGFLRRVLAGALAAELYASGYDAHTAARRPVAAAQRP
jgi:hypothetical protein